MQITCFRGLLKRRASRGQVIADRSEKNGAAARTGTSKLYFQIEEGGRIKKKLLLVSFSPTRK
jgi:hypothetical protein